MSKAITILCITKADYKMLMKKSLNFQTLKKWNLEIDNKFQKIHPGINYESTWPTSRFDVMIINRLRAGHTFLTHSYLMANESRTKCKYCDDLLSVSHIFTCVEVPERSYSMISANSKWEEDLFDASKFPMIKNFLKKNEYYKLI